MSTSSFHGSVATGDPEAFTPRKGRYLAPSGSNVATVQLRWEDPQSHGVQEINGNVNTWDLAPSFEAASPRYQLDVVLAQYAEVLRGNPWGQETTLASLAAHAQRLVALLPGDADVAEFAQLVARAAALRGH
jgi:Ca-activated chloride channel family protein